MGSGKHRLTFADDGSSGADVAWLWITCHDWDDWDVDVVTAEKGGLPQSAGSADAAVPTPWTPRHPRRWPDGEHGAIRHLRTVGDPRAVIAEHSDSDLIVMGARGRGLLKSMYIGSTADWVVLDPPAPTVIVRSGHATDRVLVCTDGSADAEYAALVVERLPWISGVEVTVLGVPEEGHEAERAVERLVERFRGAGIRASGMVREPDPLAAFYSVRDVVLTVARELEVDLLVIGSRGLSGWKARRSGSISSALARHASCSVLI
ncbi:MAG: universal stress protein, partial [Candidatus Nanopelagicales bacterium]|nr:universal stress protein [Candidatus Nanopelagicales bacterium]